MNTRGHRRIAGCTLFATLVLLAGCEGQPRKDPFANVDVDGEDPYASLEDATPITNGTAISVPVRTEDTAAAVEAAAQSIVVPPPSPVQTAEVTTDPAAPPAIVPTGHAEPKSSNTNRLARTNSPYLLLHAHNPVDWYPWGPEALEKAKKEDKPIFLSIGYSTCYWCHVMERLVFSDVDTAAYMNQHFVCIKVDREERPDVDAVYMAGLLTYFQMIESDQGGGWPMSLFLTPDGKPFMGGTYFPLEKKDGRPGFPHVCEQVVKLWDEKRNVVDEFAGIVVAQTRRTLAPSLSVKPIPLDRELAAGTVKALLASFDERFGGYGFNVDEPAGPKFPNGPRLALMQYHVRRFGDERAESSLRTTLDAMAAGGIRDHLAGGFHRYSTDREWHVPHFEKMLYDQAQLADVYTEAYRLGHLPSDRSVAESTLDFLLAEMRAPGGAFHSAIDAETNGVEGAYYVWSKDEVRRVLGEADAELFALAYGFDEPNDFEHGVVLRRTTPISEIVRHAKQDADMVERRLAEMREKLLAERSKRRSPNEDDKVLTAWNGLAVRALANAGRVFDRDDYLKAADEAAMFLLTKLRDENGKLLRSHREGTASIPAYLDDYAFTVDGLLALYEATRDEKWFNAARRLTDDQITLFWDETGHGFTLGSRVGEQLVVEVKGGYDDALPAGNAVSVRNLIRIGSISGVPDYTDRARQTLAAFAGDLRRGPTGTSTMALALGELLDDPNFGALRANPSGGSDSVADRGVQPIPTIVQAAATAEVESIRQIAGEKEEQNPILQTRAFLEYDKLPAGSKCRVVFKLSIRKDWHVNANEPGLDYKIPTAITLKSKHGTKLTGVTYPKGDEHVDEILEETSYQYDGEVLVHGTLEVPRDAAGRQEELELHVKFQACRGGRCLRPTTIKLKGKLGIVSADGPLKSVNSKMFDPTTN